MALHHQPEGLRTVTPYLTLRAVPRLIEFLGRVFDARVRQVLTQADGRVIYAEVTIGDAVVMLSEPTVEMPPMTGALYVYVKDTDAAYCRALEAGATSIAPPSDQYYGDRSARVRDMFGNVWTLGTQREILSPAELARRATQHALPRT
jgi:PhnB protein